MLESVKFPVAICPSCKRNRLLMSELSVRDALVFTCVHCHHHFPEELSPTYWGPAHLKRLGYDVEGEDDSLGCGSGGNCGGSCGTG